MRLIVDHSAAFNQAAGIGRYSRNVVPSALRELAGSPAFHLTVFYAADRAGPAPFAAEALAGLPAGVPIQVRRAPLSRRRLDQLWFQGGIGIGAKALVGSGDLVYCPDFLAPPVPATPTIATAHDLAFLVCPERAPPELVRFLRRAVSRQVREAVAIAVVSESSRRDLVERLGVAPERVTVVPNGVEPRFFDASPLDESARRRLGIPEAYLLMVGTLEPRKNHDGAFAALRAAGRRVDLPLVVAGRSGWQVTPIRRAAEDLRRSGRVLFVDHVPDGVLPSLYAGAAAVVYPSWYEGFGLPVIEAMAAGTPVAVSPAPALVEVGGGAAEVAAGWDGAAIADAIERALGPAANSRSGACRPPCAGGGLSVGASGPRAGRPASRARGIAAVEDGADEPGPAEAGDAKASLPATASPFSPRLSLILIGGVALAGIACMCLAVALLAVWQAS